MKKALQLLASAAILASVVFLQACKKETPPAPSPAHANTTTTQYYVRFKVDGILKEYYASDNAAFINTTLQSDSNFYSQFSCVDTNGIFNRRTFSISIVDTTFLQSNVSYVNFTPTSSADHQLRTFSISYKDESGVQFFNWSEQTATSLGIIADARLTITDMTATYVKATFSASLYDNSYSAVSHLLTDGELYIQRLQ